MRVLSTALAIAGFAGLAACAQKSEEATAAELAAEVQSPGDILDAVISGDQRTAEERARDQYRHPKETLLFFGAKPSMTIVEIWPGGGWYSNVIAPFLAKGGGVFYAAGLDPDKSEINRKAEDAFAAKFKADPALYGDVRMSVLGGGHAIAPEGSADMVLTFRNVHNWLSAGTAEENFKTFYKALKPGGVLGVVEHRADEDASDEAIARTGYVKTSKVKALAEAAGFEFEAASEINANPADTKDHPFGVWTLPPVRRSSAVSGRTDPDFDRAKYDAIGESDRMTLKFIKPAGAADDAPAQ